LLWSYADGVNADLLYDSASKLSFAGVFFYGWAKMYARRYEKENVLEVHFLSRRVKVQRKKRRVNFPLREE